jgi:putative tryptophan/tyrosine transport system substrate-binding protein
MAGVKLGVTLLMVPARSVEDIDRAFATMEREGLDALLVVASPLFISQRVPLAVLAQRHRLMLAMFGNSENVEAGGLMSYAADLKDSTRRAAICIDKILKGANPGDLPVEQAAKFELVINLKSARALGLTIPPPLLARADEVIE